MLHGATFRRIVSGLCLHRREGCTLSCLLSSALVMAINGRFFRQRHQYFSSDLYFCHCEAFRRVLRLSQVTQFQQACTNVVYISITSHTWLCEALAGVFIFDSQIRCGSRSQVMMTVGLFHSFAQTLSAIKYWWWYSTSILNNFRVFDDSFRLVSFIEVMHRSCGF